VDPGLEKSITIIEEVINSGIKYGFSSIFFDRNFNDKTEPQDVEILENRIDCDDMVTCMLWTAKYRNISSICTSEIVEILYYGSDEFRGNQACALTETPVLVTDIVIALQKGSPFLDHMNEIIDRLVESGIPAYLAKFSPEGKHYIKSKSIPSKTVADEYYVLTMDNMQCAFYLFLFGHSLGFISFLIEMLYFKMRVLRQ
jgi:hypothetical protein